MYSGDAALDDPRAARFACKDLSLLEPGCGCPHSCRGLHLGWQDVGRSSRRPLFRRRFVWFLIFLTMELGSHALAFVSTAAVISRVASVATVDVCCAADPRAEAFRLPLLDACHLSTREVGSVRVDQNGMCIFGTTGNGRSKSGCTMLTSPHSTRCSNTSLVAAGEPERWAAAFNETCARGGTGTQAAMADAFRHTRGRANLERVVLFYVVQLACIVFDTLVDTASAIYDFDLLEFLIRIVVLAQLVCCDVTAKATSRCSTCTLHNCRDFEADVRSAVQRKLSATPAWCLACKKIEVAIFKVLQLCYSLVLSLWVLGGHGVVVSAFDQLNTSPKNQIQLLQCGATVITKTTAPEAKVWSDISAVGFVFTAIASVARIVWMAAIVRKGCYTKCCCGCRNDRVAVGSVS